MNDYLNMLTALLEHTNCILANKQKISIFCDSLTIYGVVDDKVEVTLTLDSGNFTVTRGIMYNMVNLKGYDGDQITNLMLALLPAKVSSKPDHCLKYSNDEFGAVNWEQLDQLAVKLQYLMCSIDECML